MTMCEPAERGEGIVDFDTIEGGMSSSSFEDRGRGSTLGS
jgi:hypothetical protein